MFLSGLRKYSISVFVVLFFGISSLIAQINIRNYIELGKRELFNNQNSTAILRFNEVIKINPELFQAYFFRGVAKYNLGDYIGARADFTKTLSLHPYFSHAFHYRGISQEQLNNYNSAIKDFNAALEIDPVNPDVYVSRGFTRVMLNDTSGALADFNEAIMLDPYNFQAFLNRSLIWTMKKDFEKALQDCNKAITLDKYNIEAIYRRGLIWFNKEDLDKAQEDFDFILRIDSTSSRTFYYRALTRYKKNDLKGALSDYNQVIKLDPYNALTFYNRAILKSQIGDTQGAIFDYDQVLDLNKNNIFAFYNRGSLKLKTGDYGAAVNDFTRVIQLYPAFTQAYLSRSVARNSMNDLAGAMQDQKLAEKISNDSVLQKNLSKIDSSYFNSIIELKANFDNGNINTGDNTYKNMGVQMKKIYILAFGNVPNKTSFSAGKLNFINKKSDGQNFVTLVEANNLQANDSLFSEIPAHFKVKTGTFNYYVLQGLMYGSQRDYNQAFSILENAKRLKPNDYFYYFLLAGLKFQLTEMLNTIDSNDEFLLIVDRKKTKLPKPVDLRRDYREILDLYNRSVLLQPDFAPSYFNRGYIKSLLNDLPGAVADYDQAINLNPEMANAFYNRGLVYIYMDLRDKGCEDISKAGELGLKESYQIIRKYCR